MRPSAKAPMALRESGATLENLTVLIADGNAYSRRLTRTMLMNIGARTHLEVADGSAALLAIPELNPDVMILDWDLPVMSGPDVMSVVRSPGVFPKPNLPVIMLSDSGQRSRLDAAVRLGVHEFLVKPISSKTLQQRLFSIIVNPRPMVLADGYYVPLPRRCADLAS
jgi:two-component system, chemotaxis family, chemotaxis protein CheY